MSGKFIIIRNMDLEITWDQLMDMSSPAAPLGTIDALFTEMETTLHNGRRVIIKDPHGNGRPLRNMDEYNRWKNEFLNVQEEADVEEVEYEEEDVEFVPVNDLEIEDVEMKDLDDDEFEEVKDNK